MSSRNFMKISFPDSGDWSRGSVSNFWSLKLNHSILQWDWISSFPTLYRKPYFVYPYFVRGPLFCTIGNDRYFSRKKRSLYVPLKVKLDSPSKLKYFSSWQIWKMFIILNGSGRFRDFRNFKNRNYFRFGVGIDEMRSIKPNTFHWCSWWNTQRKLIIILHNKQY